MDWWVFLISAFAGGCSARPQQAGKGIKAIEPTAPGQIGINPADYIGTNTQYFTAEATTTRWIGVDSVIIPTITITSNNIPSTITKSAQVAVSTASEASDGVEPVQAACGLAKLNPRAGAGCSGGTARYIEENLSEEIAAEVREAIGNTVADGAGNLVELLFEGSALPASIAVNGVNIGLGAAIIAFGYLGWVSSHDGSLAPVKIPKKKIKTTTQTSTASSTATSTSSKVPLEPEPTLSFYSYPVGVPFDTSSAAAMATAIQGRFEALAAIANAATVLCTCTQIVHADGSKGELKCPILNGCENCNVISSTEAAPAPTVAPSPPSPPILQPKPDPVSPNACNKDRKDKLPEYVDSSTFNIKAAKKAIGQFCNKLTYSFENNPLKTRPQWQLYYVEGENISEADHRSLGDSERLYLAMLRDAMGLAAKLIADKEKSIASCITGFEAGFTGCEDKDKKYTMGSKNTYKCMEYLSIPSSTGSLMMPDGNAPW
ncbi:hypothetical protein HYALB_00013917 [Hymenoscyphus albidus]|uniref:Uncharacterized protein n=1 Tax=Hymenoscyphus albidus TaxID=595503 RepID=A0A9N9LZN9_9HELO|nr:hypothetical protein HYALB_00013917 [Hymenoscyphus albidus]